MVETFDRQPSDYILLVNRRYWVYDKLFFGEPEYGDQIMEWVERNYEHVKTFGAKYPTPHRFGITILKYSPEQQSTEFGSSVERLLP